jgi:hypothetical protein
MFDCDEEQQVSTTCCYTGEFSPLAEAVTSLVLRQHFVFPVCLLVLNIQWFPVFVSMKQP